MLGWSLAELNGFARPVCKKTVSKNNPTKPKFGENNPPPTI